MMSLRISLKNRPDAFDSLGGDTIEMLEMKRFLEKRGHRVSINLDPSKEGRDADIVHLFNLNRPGDPYRQALSAKEKGNVVVLSAIYWNMDEFMERAVYPSTAVRRVVKHLNLSVKIEGCLKNARDRVMGIKVDEGILLERSIGRRKIQEDLLSVVDLVITGSRIERDILRRDFQFEGKILMIPKGIHPRFMEETGRENLWGLESGFVLSVGRIELHKNQLSSICALRGLDADYVLAGEAKSAEADYFSRCKRASGGNVHFLGFVDHTSLPSLYQQAKVHLQPSWYEIPGLATLEAAVSGCNVVVTDRGSAYEYLGDMAWYVDPSDEMAIREAVEEAYRSPPKPELQAHLIESYRWEKVAELLEEAYLAALES